MLHIIIVSVSKMSWDLADRQIAQYTSATPIPKEVVENARLLIAFGRRCAYPSPDAITVNNLNGSTLCFHWDVRPKSIEVEVDEDRFEFYSFGDGDMDIRHIAIGRDHCFPVSLAAALSVAFGVSAR